MRGPHNRENAAAATAAARAIGVDDDAIAEALRSFAGVPHRLELVGERDGVRYVNDSKATNVAAARRALAAYGDEPVRLILGGSLKGEDFAPLAEAIGPNVRSIHLIGEAAPVLAAALTACEPFVDGELARAVGHAAALASSGEVILLSPACASYDQFENFERRGEAFRELRRGLGISPRPAKETDGVKRGELDSRLLILVTMALVAFGLVMVYSATSAAAAVGGKDPSYYLKRQGMYAALGIVLMVLAQRWDYRRLRLFAPLLVGGSLVLLTAVLVIGPPVNGARRWISFGPAVFQPSELAKLALCIWAAALLGAPPGAADAQGALAPGRRSHGRLLRAADPRAGPRHRDRPRRDARGHAARRGDAGPDARARASGSPRRSARRRSGSSPIAAPASSRSCIRGTTPRGPASRSCRR